jgi:uncharacterized membrane protein
VLILKRSMASLRDAKIFGGIGSILMIIIPVVGEVLVIIAAKNISEVTKEESIYKNVLYAMLLIIIGSLVSTVIIYGSVFSVFMNPVNAFTRIRTGLFLSLVVAGIFLTIGAIFLRRGFNRIADLFNINYFRTAALIFLIGAILVIAFIGGIVILIAEVFMIIAFFSLPEQQAMQTEPSLIPPPPA